MRKLGRVLVAQVHLQGRTPAMEGLFDEIKYVHQDRMKEGVTMHVIQDVPY